MIGGIPLVLISCRNVFGAERKGHGNSMKTVKQCVLDGTSKWSAKIAITGQFICVLWVFSFYFRSVARW